MATESWFLRLPCIDRDDQPILVHISRKPEGQTLDLDILATDGESAYRAKVRDRKLEKLRSTGYESTPEEWSSILRYVFLPSTSDSVDLPESLRDTLQVTCVLSGKAKKPILNIIIRQSVGEITHKFGSLQLLFSEDTDDVDLFGWASEAAMKRDQLAGELRISNGRIKKAEATIQALQGQLRELISAKEEHETQLISKFVVLLNEKKLRIRSQQRQIVEGRPSPRSRSAARAKDPRKRKDLEDATPDEASESDGFDMMNVDQDEVTIGDVSNGGRTPSIESDTASELSLEPNYDLNTPASKQPPTTDTIAIPPPRELPFGLRPKASRSITGDKMAKSPISDNDDTASEEDDEL